MPALPKFPTQSLYGKFPTFPTYKFGYSTNILGYNLGFTVKLPNIGQIGTYLEDIAQWLIGWGAAIFEWVFRWLSDEAQNGANWIISEITYITVKLTTVSEQVAKMSGIAEPLIFSIFAGLIIIGMIIVVIIIINTAKVFL